jgi:RNA polymerase sigma-54 factor
MMDLAPDVHQAALALSWSLTETGYLDATPAEIAVECALHEDTVVAGLRALQSCDPPGVGARSLAECLCLQLVDKGIAPPVAEAATGVLDLLARNEWAQAARATDLTAEALRTVARLLPGLSPYPGQAIGAAPQISAPDVEVGFPEGAPPQIRVLRGRPTDMTLDADLMAAARREASDTALARYGAEADALYRALGYRANTLERIVAFLVDYQSSFFCDGASAMRPLTREALAERLGLHPATVGRAVADKTLAHAHGVIPLSAFFSARLGPDPGEGPSAYGVQSRIAALVAAESEAAILTDDEIAHRLKEDGVDIARRTVAKYRRCLNIPSSYDRKRLKAAARMRGRMMSSG